MKKQIQVITCLALFAGMSVHADVTYSFIAGPSTSWPTPPTINFSDPPGATFQTLAPDTVNSQTFLAPAGLNTLNAFYLYGNGGAATLNLHLYDLGTTAPTTGYDPGVNLFSGLSVAYNGNGSPAIQQFTFTGADQVTLIGGHYYAIELYNAASSANSFFWARQGAAGSLYTDGSMYSGTGTGTRSLVVGADRDSVGSLYLTPVPEPSTLALLGVGVAGLLVLRRKRA